MKWSPADVGSQLGLPLLRGLDVAVVGQGPTEDDGCLLGARFTLAHLKLNDEAEIIRFRQEWYRMYETGDLSLAGLRAVAPLIARAIERREQNHGRNDTS